MTSSSGAPGTSSPPKRKWGGYNPKIHGSFDPNADYAKEAEKEEEDAQQAVSAAAFAARNAHGSSHDYTTTASTASSNKLVKALRCTTTRIRAVAK